MGLVHKLRDSRKLRTWVTTISCMLLMMCLSAISYFGAIINYFYSYYRNKPIRLVEIDCLWMLTAYQVIAPVGMTFGSKFLSRRIGDFRSIVFFAMIFACSAFASFFSIVEPLGLLFTFGIVQGFCSGALFNLAWKICMKSTSWPNAKPGPNFAGGIMSCGTPISALLISELALLVVNPYNEISDLSIDNAKFFTQLDILDRVPFLFIMQGCLCAVVHSVGIGMLWCCLKADKLASSTYGVITEESPVLQEGHSPMVTGSPVLQVDQRTHEEDQSGLDYSANNGDSNLRRRSNSSRNVHAKQRRHSGKQSDGDDSFSDRSCVSEQGSNNKKENKKIHRNSLTNGEKTNFGSTFSVPEVDTSKRSFSEALSSPAPTSKVPNNSMSESASLQHNPKASSGNPLPENFSSSAAYGTFVNQRKGSIVTEPADTDMVPKDAAKTSKFWLLWTISLMLNVTCFIFANLYKECGQVYLNNDALTTNAGVLSNVFMIGVRPLFGKFVDMKGIRAGLFIPTVGCTVFVVATMYSLHLGSAPLYMLFVVLEINSIATIWPFTNYAAREAFGMTHYGEITALLFTALMPPYLILPMILPTLIKALGWMYVLLLAEAASFVAFFLGFLYHKT